MKSSGSANLESGMSLISVLVAMGIMSIIAYTLSTSLVNTFHAVRHAELQADVIDLHAYLLTRVDCIRTIAGIKENPHSVELVDSTPSHRPLVKRASQGSYTKIGPYSLRASVASCPNCSGGRKILVEFAALGANGFSNDPLTGKLSSWSDLYGGVPYACPVPAP